MHHVEIRYVLQNLIKALKPHGALFVSLKRGVGRVFESGRLYTLFEEATLRELLGELAGAKLESLRSRMICGGQSFGDGSMRYPPRSSTDCASTTLVDHLAAIPAPPVPHGRK